jgi:hypothetical protein
MVTSSATARPQPPPTINHPGHVRHVLVDNNRTTTSRPYEPDVQQCSREGLLTSKASMAQAASDHAASLSHSRLKQPDKMIGEATGPCWNWQHTDEALDITGKWPPDAGDDPPSSDSCWSGDQEIRCCQQRFAYMEKPSDHSERKMDHLDEP